MFLTTEKSMDEIVKQAMAKWPDVPNVYGWLSLDRRGVWRIKGDAVANPAIAGFISRNYDHDAQGRWFFQNGPQRVFVALEYTPYVYRAVWDADPRAPLRIETHTAGQVRNIDSAWVDETGILLLVTERGVGMVDDRNLESLLPCFTDAAGHALEEDAIAARIESLQAGDAADLCLRYAGGSAAVSAIAAAAVAAKFGFVPQPAPLDGEQACA
jgi:hypothetical protein